MCAESDRLRVEAPTRIPAKRFINAFSRPAESRRSETTKVIRTADLKTQTRRELADLAKNFGVDGWHGMKKDELVDAIAKIQARLRLNNHVHLQHFLRIA